jgi:cytochrome c oxidase subunit 2
VLTAAAALMLAGCTGWQSAIDVHGASAISIKQLIILIVAVCSAVWAMVMVVLIRALWRGRTERDRPADPDHQTERRMTTIVTAATAATVVILIAFTAASFFTTRALSLGGHDDLTIKVRGQQWWWSVEYLSPAERRLQTANEIHIPVGRNVRVQLEGTDVIHSFWVPNLAGKQDLIPGRPNTLTIRAERPGVYRGQCAEFCGLQHAHMAFLVVAERPAEFEAWRRAQLQPARSPSNDEEEAGRKVFLAKPCAACHTIAGTTASGTLGPDLTHVASRKYIGAGLVETTRGALAAWIADPQTLKPGVNMPLVPLSSDELRAVSAYLASLK